MKGLSKFVNFCLHGNAGNGKQGPEKEFGIPPIMPIGLVLKFFIEKIDS